MKFRIGDARYEVESVDRLTLAHWMRIERETEALGKPMTWSQVRDLVERVSSLPSWDEAQNDPDFPWLIGIVVWASRVQAGERTLTLEQAVDFPMGDFEFIDDTPARPQDHKASGGGARPRKPRPASGRGAGSRAGAAAARKTTSRSATPSSDD